MDREAWRATIHVFAESTALSKHTHTIYSYLKIESLIKSFKNPLYMRTK